MVAYSKIAECGEDQLPKPTNTEIREWLKYPGGGWAGIPSNRSMALLALDRLEAAEATIKALCEGAAELSAGWRNRIGIPDNTQRVSCAYDLDKLFKEHGE